MTVSQSSGVFTITDAQGRSLSIEQGNGSGYFFGSDYQNSGSLNVEANVSNGLFVEWDNDDLVIKHTKGAGVDITNFSSSALGTATFDVADTASSALKEPITFQDNADSTYASVSGVIGSSKIALNFSDTFGYGGDRRYLGRYSICLLNMALKLQMEMGIIILTFPLEHRLISKD